VCCVVLVTAREPASDSPEALPGRNRPALILVNEANHNQLRDSRAGACYFSVLRAVARDGFETTVHSREADAWSGNTLGLPRTLGGPHSPTLGGVDWRRTAHSQEPPGALQRDRALGMSAAGLRVDGFHLIAGGHSLIAAGWEAANVQLHLATRGMG